MEILVTANSGIKKGGIFMKNIIDNTIDKNIELYYAFFQFVSCITLQKISTIETRKNELKHQMKNTEQKTLITYKKGEQIIFLFTFYRFYIIYKISHGFLMVGILFPLQVPLVYQTAFAQ